MPLLISLWKMIVCLSAQAKNPPVGAQGGGGTYPLKTYFPSRIYA